MHLTEKTLDLARAVIRRASSKGIMIATAESCTAGLISASLTEIAGSSSVVDRGFVTYSNEAKTELLGVDAKLIQKFGAVSPQVAQAMAQGALEHSQASLTVSVTGIAGPDGGSEEKPVGLVEFGSTRKAPNGETTTIADTQIFANQSREQVRASTVEHALALLLKQLDALS